MTNISRRHFVARSTSCAAHIALAAAFVPASVRHLWANVPLGPVVAREPFGNLEKIADGIWALISTPLSGDRTTLSNGGIITGKNAVLAIEGFNQPEGAVWLAGKAKELTGRWPTHVAITHYHSDHSNGVAGYLSADRHPVVRSTGVTRDLVIERNKPADDARTAALRGAELLSIDVPTSLDLGGRTLRVIPRSGHTASDVSIELDEPSTVFCGDLLWNAMVPNYVDATPSALRKSVAAVGRDRDTLYVPGHGALARQADFDRYVAMLDEIESAARRFHAQGLSPADAGATYALPASLGQWTLFNKVFFERAFAAWYRELGA